MPEYRKYYILAVRENGKWGPQFSDHSRQTVQSELDSYRGEYRAKDLKILVTHYTDQVVIDHMIEQENLKEKVSAYERGMARFNT